VNWADAQTLPDTRRMPTGSEALPDDEAPVPLTRTGRPARAPRPAALPPARAVAGAGVAVAGVALGIGTLLWASDSPQGDPTVRPAGSAVGGSPQVLLTGPPSASGGSPLGDSADSPAVPDPASPPAVNPPAAPPAAAPSAPQPPSLVIPVTVLNNSRYPNLAVEQAARFERGGWPIRSVGNFTGRIVSTTVYYEPGQEASARAFADAFEGMVRVLPRFQGLPGSGLTIVVTRDLVP